LTLDKPGKCLGAGALLLGLAAAASALAADNPLARGTWGSLSSAPIEGVWNGTDLERRSNCASVQNNGAHGTYAEFDASTDAVNHVLQMNQIGITGLSCTYRGNYQGVGSSIAWKGTYSCTDGKRGSFSSRDIVVTANGLAMHLDVKLDTTESCTIEAVIGAGRFYP
jgi:hypothetical protein